MKDLIAYPADAERSHDRKAQWQQSTALLKEGQLQFASGVAFLIRGDSDMSQVRAKSNADLIIGLAFRTNMAVCEIHLDPCTDVGKNITNFLLKLPENNNGIVVRERSEVEIQRLPNLFDGTI